MALSHRREQLIEAVRLKLGGTATTGAAELALGAVLRALTDGLRRDGEVRLSGFGSFRIKERASRRLLLPGSDTAMCLPARRIVSFTPSPRLQSRTASASADAADGARGADAAEEAHPARAAGAAGADDAVPGTSSPEGDRRA